jgi:fatty-acyl-CoA synthase
MYIGDYLGRREIYSPDKVAIIDAGKPGEPEYTYRQMNERANRLANFLHDEVGIRKGERVGIFARDGIEHLDLFFALSKLGAVHVAFNWRLHPQELCRLTELTTPKAIVYSEDFRLNIAQLQASPASASITHYLHIEGPGVADSRSFAEVRDASRPDPVTCDTLEKEDIAALLFTGGTTGLPKGAEISHEQIGWNTLNTVIHDITHNDVYVNVFPMFHTGGLFVYTLPQVIFGGTTILTHQFDPAQVLDLIERYNVTVFGGVPTMYQMMTEAPNWATADLSSLRFCTSGGAPLPVPLVQKYTAEKGIRFKQGFGMTEFGPGIFALAPEDAVRKAGSIGRPNFFVDARIVDDDNRPLPPEQVGELVLKGPSYCSGYWQNEEASAAAVDGEGWFHTGDAAYCDEEWYFFIVDRIKDMFISGGENVYPAEIEAVLYKHPAVHMCAVAGVPDPKWGEIGVACVVLKQGASATGQELLAFLTDNLARYKVPKRVRFFDALPISAAGKILKRELREQMLQSTAPATHNT